MTIASLSPLPTKIPGIERVYLTGPRTGLPEFNHPAFYAVAAVLRDAGYEVYNPAEEVALDTTGLTGHESSEQIGFPLRIAFSNYARYITEDAHAVAVLPGWENATDARGEVALAAAVGLPVLDALTGEAIDVEISARTTTAEERAVEESIARHPAGNRPGPLLTVTETLTEIENRDETDRSRHLAAVPTSAGTGEVRMTSATGGQKGAKEAAYDLIPPGPLKELAVLYGRGNVKYPPEPGEMANWKRGYPWSLSYAALRRHLDLFWMGEDHDPEMGVKHLINVAWHAFNLAWFMENRPGFDDRPIKGETYVGALPTPQWITDLQAERAAAAANA